MRCSPGEDEGQGGRRPTCGGGDVSVAYVEVMVLYPAFVGSSIGHGTSLMRVEAPCLPMMPMISSSKTRRTLRPGRVAFAYAMRFLHAL